MPSHDDLANAIRALAMDAVQQANSGHPGMPMGTADMATVLFGKFLKFDPARPGLARSRPLRAVRRPRLDAALRAALSDRLSGDDHRAAQALPAARLEDRRPPGARPCAGHRDHHRPARPGPGERGRHGARRAPAARALRRGPGRPPHLCVRERRRPHGGHQPRGLLVRRAPAARPADRALRRQPHHASTARPRSPSRTISVEAFRRLWLAQHGGSTATIRRRSRGR